MSAMGYDAQLPGSEHQALQTHRPTSLPVVKAKAIDADPIVSRDADQDATGAAPVVLSILDQEASGAGRRPASFIIPDHDASDAAAALPIIPDASDASSLVIVKARHAWKAVALVAMKAACLPAAGVAVALEASRRLRHRFDSAAVADPDENPRLVDDADAGAGQNRSTMRRLARLLWVNTKLYVISLLPSPLPAAGALFWIVMAHHPRRISRVAVAAAPPDTEHASAAAPPSATEHSSAAAAELPSFVGELYYRLGLDLDLHLAGHDGNASSTAPSIDIPREFEEEENTAPETVEQGGHHRQTLEALFEGSPRHVIVDATGSRAPSTGSRAPPSRGTKPHQPLWRRLCCDTSAVSPIAKSALRGQSGGNPPKRHRAGSGPHRPRSSHGHHAHGGSGGAPPMPPPPTATPASAAAAAPAASSSQPESSESLDGYGSSSASWQQSDSPHVSSTLGTEQAVFSSMGAAEGASSSETSQHQGQQQQPPPPQDQPLVAGSAVQGGDHPAPIPDAAVANVHHEQQVQQQQQPPPQNQAVQGGDPPAPIPDVAVANVHQEQQVQQQQQQPPPQDQAFQGGDPQDPNPEAAVANVRPNDRNFNWELGHLEIASQALNTLYQRRDDDTKDWKPDRKETYAWVLLSGFFMVACSVLASTASVDQKLIRGVASFFARLSSIGATLMVSYVLSDTIGHLQGYIFAGVMTLVMFVLWLAGNPEDRAVMLGLFLLILRILLFLLKILFYYPLVGFVFGFNYIAGCIKIGWDKATSAVKAWFAHQPGQQGAGDPPGNARVGTI